MIAPVKEKTTNVISCKVFKEPDVEEPDDFVLRINPITAHAGETLRWVFYDKESRKEVDHIFSIWFPEAGVFVTPLISVMHNGAVEATIRDDVRKDVPADKLLVYEYCIYDHSEHEFVTCHSHPRIEIPGAGG
ncbi:MAG: hypothetical protein KAW67_10065 [Candidatus Eisenbacteria sp.]|nr:hypothetical protein [Candidatus Eisenbacteria bacterium]